MKIGNPSKAQRAAPKRTKSQSICQVFGKQKTGKSKNSSLVALFILAIGGASTIDEIYSKKAVLAHRLWGSKILGGK